MMASQEKKVTKAPLECKGGEESREEWDPQDFTKGTPEAVDRQGLQDSQALQGRLG